MSRILFIIVAIALLSSVARACRVDSDCSHIGNSTRCDKSIIPCLRKDYQCSLDKTKMVYAVAGDSVNVHCDYSSSGHCTFVTERRFRIVNDSSPYATLPLGPVISCLLENCTISRVGNDITMACNESTCSCAGSCDKFVTQILSKINGYCAIDCHEDNQICTISHHAFPMSISADCSEQRGGSIYECVDASSQCIQVYGGKKDPLPASKEVFDWTYPFCISSITFLIMVLVCEAAYSAIISVRENYSVRKERADHIHHPGIANHLTIYKLEVFSGPQRILKLEPVVLRPGNIYIIMGKTGCGKTTFFKALSNRRDYTNNLKYQRDIMIDNALRPTLRERNIFSLSILDEDFMKNATPLIQLRATCFFNDRPMSEVDALLDTVEMAKSKDTLAKNLSRGQKSRLSSCEALLGRQPVLILDEPFANLDLPTQRKLNTEILRQSSLGRLIILSVHEAPDDLFKNEDGVWRDNVFVMVIKDGVVHRPIDPESLFQRFGDTQDSSIAGHIADRYGCNVSFDGDEEYDFFVNGTDIQMDDMNSERGSSGEVEDFVHDTTEHNLMYKHELSLNNLSKYRVPTFKRIASLLRISFYSGVTNTCVFLLFMGALLLGPSLAVASTPFSVAGCKSRFVLLVQCCIATYLVSLQQALSLDIDIFSDIKRIVSGQCSVRDYMHAKVILVGSMGRLLFFGIIYAIISIFTFERDWEGPHQLDWLWFSFIGMGTYFINLMIHIIMYTFTYSEPSFMIGFSSVILLVFSSLSGILFDSSNDNTLSYLRWASPWSFSIESSLCLLFNEREIEIDVSGGVSLSVDGSYWVSLLGFSPGAYWRAIGCLVILAICSYYVAYAAMKRAMTKHGSI